MTDVTDTPTGEFVIGGEGDDESSILEALEKDFQEVLQELVGDKRLARFQAEYEKLHGALKKSHESKSHMREEMERLRISLRQQERRNSQVQIHVNLGDEYDKMVDECRRLRQDLGETNTALSAAQQEISRLKDHISGLEDDAHHYQQKELQVSQQKEARIQRLHERLTAVKKEDDRQPAPSGSSSTVGSPRNHSIQLSPRSDLNQMREVMRERETEHLCQLEQKDQEISALRLKNETLETSLDEMKALIEARTADQEKVETPEATDEPAVESLGSSIEHAEKLEAEQEAKRHLKSEEWRSKATALQSTVVDLREGLSNLQRSLDDSASTHADEVKGLTEQRDEREAANAKITQELASVREEAATREQQMATARVEDAQKAEQEKAALHASVLEKEKHIDELKGELVSVRSANDGLQRDLGDAKAELKESAKQFEDNINEWRNKAAVLEKKVEGERDAKKDLEQDLTTTKQQLASVREEAATREQQTATARVEDARKAEQEKTGLQQRIDELTSELFDVRSAKSGLESDLSVVKTELETATKQFEDNIKHFLEMLFQEVKGLELETDEHSHSQANPRGHDAVSAPWGHDLQSLMSQFQHLLVIILNETRALHREVQQQQRAAKAETLGAHVVHQVQQQIVLRWLERAEDQVDDLVGEKEALVDENMVLRTKLLQIQEEVSATYEKLHQCTLEPTRDIAENLAPSPTSGGWLCCSGRGKPSPCCR
ncbi:unnamed protein product [Vitrella brassicaformis CCMP3155]|uniref:Uncharacterized protein n=1 Tax=Vitrella brassicaformis (strain CCMP3155) TaxID=1169540 RepID=A0A0G4EKV8_VITBC|nr:unnamed protein product [Vitrella brassicaformis CCMP3155]|eukprot:CEL97806.1 unnamed protein product [Vitrella brassicaformis CCMP3155]